MSLGDFIGLETSTEVFFVNLYLIINLIVDPCFFNIYSSLRLVDAIAIKGRHHPLDILTKLSISLIVILKCSLNYIMLACQIMSLYPIFYSDLADLLTPLIMVSIFRNVFLNVLEFGIGLLFCYYDLTGILPCLVFSFKYAFIIIASSYYTYILMRLYFHLKRPTIDRVTPVFIDSENFARKRRIKASRPRQMNLSLMDTRAFDISSSTVSSSFSNIDYATSSKKPHAHVSWRQNVDKE